ncbi:ZGPAT protein, partial [Chunga burmeisteri]|nr:ZGPAT protein [Chunga burmeisteri]
KKKESLEAAKKTYNAQLQQVELALGAGSDPSQQSDKKKLQEDLKKKIELTESKKKSVKKSKKKTTLDTNAKKSSSPVGQKKRDTNPDGSAQDEEYAAFKEAIADLGTDEKPSANNNEISSKRGEETDDKNESKYSEEEEESDREEEEEEELSGMKVKAPYYSSWGTLEYHNAMIVGTEDLEDGSAGVRVLYLYPTHKSLKPCPFFLDDKCRFKENCRLLKCCEKNSSSAFPKKISHGQVVKKEELQPFQKNNLSALEKKTACLAKQKKGIWYTAKKNDIDSGYYTVKFDSLLLKEAVVEGDSVIPPLRSDDGAESESDEDSVDDSGYAKRVPEKKKWTPACSKKIGGWEAQKKGIGSKLQKKMGYEFGKGLGKNSKKRVEPVQAKKLPRGKSQKKCAEVLQKKKQGKLDPKKSRKCRAKGSSSGQSPAGSRKPPRKKKDFLNEKQKKKSTGEKKKRMTLPERKKKEIYHAKKNTKKALSKKIFQTMEKKKQTQKDIKKNQQALARKKRRHSIATEKKEEKLANKKKQLGQLQKKEASLQREKKKADTHKKKTEF